MKKYKLNEFDANSPGFIGRERKRLDVFHAGQKYQDSTTLADQVEYYDALVAFLGDYVVAPIEELEKLSLNDLSELHNRVLKHITEKEEPDPKDSGSTAEQ